MLPLPARPNNELKVKAVEGICCETCVDSYFLWLANSTRNELHIVFIVNIYIFFSCFPIFSVQRLFKRFTWTEWISLNDYGNKDLNHVCFCPSLCLPCRAARSISRPDKHQQGYKDRHD